MTNKTKVSQAIPGVASDERAKRRAYKTAEKRAKDLSVTVSNDNALEKLLRRVSNVRHRARRAKREPTGEELAAIRAGFGKVLHDLHPTHFLTFTAALQADPITFGGNITKFLCRLERQALGRNWNKHSEDRIKAICFLEKADSNPHYHGLVWMPSVTDLAMRDHADPSWKDLVRSGQFHADYVFDDAGLADYVTKELFRRWSDENVVIYKPFCHGKRNW